MTGGGAAGTDAVAADELPARLPSCWNSRYALAYQPIRSHCCFNFYVSQPLVIFWLEGEGVRPFCAAAVLADTNVGGVAKSYQLGMVVEALWSQCVQQKREGALLRYASNDALARDDGVWSL